MNTQVRSPLGWTGWISLQSKDSQESSPIPQCKSINSLALSFLYSPTLTSIHDNWKNHSFDEMDFCWQRMSLLFNMLSSLVISFLPRSKCLLISWLQSPSAVILELQKMKSLTVSTVSPSICHKAMGPDAMILVFWMLSFKPPFSTLFFCFHQEALQFFFASCHKGGVICTLLIGDTLKCEKTDLSQLIKVSISRDGSWWLMVG